MFYQQKQCYYIMTQHNWDWIFRYDVNEYFMELLTEEKNNNLKLHFYVLQTIMKRILYYNGNGSMYTLNFKQFIRFFI